MIAPASSYAGPGSSGGGPGIVCPGPDGKIATVEMVDLYEGRIRFGLDIPESGESVPGLVLEQVDKVKKFDPMIGHDVLEAVVQITKNQAFLPPGVVMSPGADLGGNYAVVMPDGCDIRYVGYYESDGTLRISQTMYNKMTPTNQAAFYIHEALYKLVREYSFAKDSTVARHLTALLFSKSGDLSKYPDLTANLTWGGGHYAPGNWKRLQLPHDEKLHIKIHAGESTQRFYYSVSCTKGVDLDAPVWTEASSYTVGYGNDVFINRDTAGCRGLYISVSSVNPAELVTATVSVQVGDRQVFTDEPVPSHQFLGVGFYRY